eukprot:1947701-Rhodomonas_salina.1
MPVHMRYAMSGTDIGSMRRSGAKKLHVCGLDDGAIFKFVPTSKPVRHIAALPHLTRNPTPITDIYLHPQHQTRHETAYLVQKCTQIV